MFQCKYYMFYLFIISVLAVALLQNLINSYFPWSITKIVYVVREMIITARKMIKCIETLFGIYDIHCQGSLIHSSILNYIWPLLLLLWREANYIVMHVIHISLFFLIWIFVFCLTYVEVQPLMNEFIFWNVKVRKFDLFVKRRCYLSLNLPMIQNA